MIRRMNRKCQLLESSYELDDDGVNFTPRKEVYLKIREVYNALCTVIRNCYDIERELKKDGHDYAAKQFDKLDHEVWDLHMRFYPNHFDMFTDDPRLKDEYNVEDMMNNESFRSLFKYIYGVEPDDKWVYNNFDW